MASLLRRTISILFKCWNRQPASDLIFGLVGPIRRGAPWSHRKNFGATPTNAIAWRVSCAEQKRARGAAWLNDGSRVQNRQTASTRLCNSENRTDRSPIEEPRTGGLKSPRKSRIIDYVATDQNGVTATSTRTPNSRRQHRGWEHRFLKPKPPPLNRLAPSGRASQIRDAPAFPFPGHRRIRLASQIRDIRLRIRAAWTKWPLVPQATYADFVNCIARLWRLI
jgi:hypothetical protein